LFDLSKLLGRKWGVRLVNETLFFGNSQLSIVSMSAIDPNEVVELLPQGISKEVFAIWWCWREKFLEG
jgi:hypothetical protein